MQTIKIFSAVLVFIFGCMPPAFADTRPATQERVIKQDRVPGVELAENISQITGVAISPLLGVSTIGAWRYYHSPVHARPLLPWFCRPYIWGAGLCLLVLCFLKDVFGTVAPPLLKKPLDVIELFENKASALVASSAFVPLMMSQLSPTGPSQTWLVSPPTPALASVSVLGAIDARFVAIPLAVLGFLVVWLACHAIHVLIVLCPFGFVDSILKLLKTFLLSSVVATAFINPYLGAAVSLVILGVAALLAPWAFRLTVFGTLFGLDVLLPARGRKGLQPTKPHAFLARKLAGVPVRTYGRLARADTSAVFTYRPWLIFPKRSVNLPAGDLTVCKGLFFPSLLHGPDGQARRSMLVFFLPRYRSHEPVIATHFSIGDVQDSPLLKGFQAVRNWCFDTLRVGQEKGVAFLKTPRA